MYIVKVNWRLPPPSKNEKENKSKQTNRQKKSDRQTCSKIDVFSIDLAKTEIYFPGFVKQLLKKMQNRKV